MNLFQHMIDLINLYFYSQNESQHTPRQKLKWHYTLKKIESKDQQYITFNNVTYI